MRSGSQVPMRQTGQYRRQWDKLTGATTGLQVCAKSNDGFRALESEARLLDKSIHRDASCVIGASVITTGHGPKTTGEGVTAIVSTVTPVAAAGALKSPPGANGRMPMNVHLKKNQIAKNNPPSYPLSCRSDRQLEAASGAEKQISETVSSSRTWQVSTDYVLHTLCKPITTAVV
jgi:hypothetical protein